MSTISIKWCLNVWFASSLPLTDMSLSQMDHGSRRRSLWCQSNQTDKSNQTLLYNMLLVLLWSASLCNLQNRSYDMIYCHALIFIRPFTNLMAHVWGSVDLRRTFLFYFASTDADVKHRNQSKLIIYLLCHPTLRGVNFYMFLNFYTFPKAVL